MSDNGNSDFGAFLAGFVIGGLVGAAVALIMAPQSGEEMRTQLVARSTDLRETGAERWVDYRDRASSIVADARSQAAQTTAQVQEQARIVLDEGRARLRTHAADETGPETEKAAQAAPATPEDDQENK